MSSEDRAVSGFGSESESDSEHLSPDQLSRAVELNPADER